MDTKSTLPELANRNNQSIKSSFGSTFKKEGLYEDLGSLRMCMGNLKLLVYVVSKGTMRWTLVFDNFYCKYTTIGRDVLDGKYECVINETRFYLKDSSYVYKMTTHVHPLLRTKFKEEGPKMGPRENEQMFKVVEAYLIANPGAYP
ncbi:hypothetical protein Ancab_019528 [Ancistrocladus abbreviatus]